MPASPPSSREWDARTYHQVSQPQFAWGLAVLERLPLRGDETVVDAGCGTGRLTRVLAERLPRGRVIAVDLSRNMLERAREHLGDLLGRVELVEADLTRLTLSTPADAIFSAATFHWVLDHDALFRSLWAALKPGGRLVAQCGGAGNLRRLRARAAEQMQRPPWREAFQGFTEAWRYAAPEETAQRLTAAGFVDVHARLEPAPTRFADAASFEAFCRGVVARVYLNRLPDQPEREAFLRALISAAATDDPPFTLDYVRLNLDAVRP